jgi:hypothetical protein
MSNESSSTTHEGLSWYRRAAATPLRDIVRGHLSGRMDLERCYAEAGLPTDAERLLRETVRRARVWRLERVDVARELIAHFRDGLASGAAVEQLVKDFGDPKAAARLIRAGVRRKRPFVWWVWRRTWQTLGTLLALLVTTWSILAIRFFSGEPRITRNYLKEFNAGIIATPRDERGWTAYRPALLAIKRDAKSDPDIARYSGSKPGEEHWPQQRAQVERLREQVHVLREAAGLHTLGFNYEAPWDAELWSGQPVPEPQSENPELMGVMIPYLVDLRMAARLLASDARVGMESNDGARTLESTKALLGMARQLRAEPFHISHAVALSVLDLACSIGDEAIARAPGFFSDEQLRAMAEAIRQTAPESRIRLTLDSQRNAFADVMQRMYTDDGSGDGRLTPGAVRQLLYSSNLGELLPMAASRPPVVSKVVAPLGLFIYAGRRDTQAKYDSIIDEYDRWSQIPLWKWQGPTAASTLLRADSSAIAMHRFAVIAMFMPDVKGSYLAGERITQARDVTLVVIAMERYRLAQGRWPSSLQELVPAYLPAVPPDRLDGQALRYRLREDRPVLYSVGMDRKDDGGRSVFSGSDRAPVYAQDWKSAEEVTELLEKEGPARTSLDGDVLLWPEPSLPVARKN